MNYLAHLYVSDPDPIAWAGSLMGDFLKGPLPEGGDPHLRKHLLLHRKLDTFAAGNAHFLSSCRRLDTRYRFGRSILIDVFYDHFLACHWNSLADVPLETFSAQVYAGLSDCQEMLPTGLRQLLPRMVREDWLCSYRDPAIVGRVLMSLERRLRHRLPLAQGVDDLTDCRAALEADFGRFIAEAVGFVGEWKADYVETQRS